jgi:HlyD family secretion protein
MKRRLPILIVVLLIAAAGLIWSMFGRSEKERYLSGYIEGEELYLAAPVSGTVQAIAAKEGARVTAGTALFAIDPATLSAQGDQARAEIAAARTQIASAQANAEQAEAEVRAAAASAERARQDLARLESVRRSDPAAVAGKDLDAARAALREASARVAAARETASARRAQIAATRAQAEQAEGGAREVAIRVGQLSPAAPADARVDKLFYQQGEWVNANQPVLSLLPDSAIKLRFYVPEGEIARYRPDATVGFSCDGCPAGLKAKISYVSPRPEFTPPVIFSRETRDRLVFLVEARPEQAANLMPGLPIDVEPLP